MTCTYRVRKMEATGYYWLLQLVTITRTTINITCYYNWVLQLVKTDYFNWLHLDTTHGSEHKGFKKWKPLFGVIY